MSVLQPSILCTIPPTILESIALEAALLDPLGPPADIVPLLQTCRYINDVLCLQNCRHLYARIFRSMFDFRAASRRFGPRGCYSSNLAVQLKKYCTTLKHLRQADLDSDTLNLDLWNAFFMMIENDGRNVAQLEWAGLKGFVDRLVRERLWHNREASHDWPAENTVNALALWLMWFTTDQATIEAELATPEGDQRRLQLMDLVRPYVVTAVRYPAFHAPDNHFDFPLSPELRREFPYSLITPHGFYPLYRQPSLLVERHTHYNMQLDIAPPPITIAAKLLYFSRSEAMPIPLNPLIPVDRAAALVRQQERYPNERPFPEPTQADWREFNTHKGAKLVNQGNWDWRTDLNPEEGVLEDDGVWRKGLKAASAKWDNDWHRFTGCWDPWVLPQLKGVVYTFGAMHGLWAGRMLIPDITEYFSLVTSATFPSNFSVENPRMTLQPIFFNLREHHCINPQLPVGNGGQHDGFDEGIRNGWFPTVDMTEHGGFVRVTDNERDSFVSKYETYVPGKTNSHNEETCTECLGRKQLENEELAARVKARERMDRLSADMALKAKQKELTGKGKRKREGVEAESESEADERARRKLTPPNQARQAPEQLEDSDALAYLSNDVHPNPRVAASKAGNDDDHTDNDSADDDSKEDITDVPSSPSSSSHPASTGPRSGTNAHSDDFHHHRGYHARSPSSSDGTHTPHREASLHEVRVAVEEALGPDQNIDDIIDQVMAEGEEQPSSDDEDEDDDEEDEGTQDEVAPTVVYGDGPENFEGDRDEIEGLTVEEDDYTEYIENTCNGIQDIIITGETLPRHGQAFHHFRFYGRVRRWDGLVALVRFPVEYPRLGVYIFRGYVTANRNWVGSWRAFTNNVRAIPLEGPFIASRVDEN